MTLRSNYAPRWVEAWAKTQRLVASEYPLIQLDDNAASIVAGLLLVANEIDVLSDVLRHLVEQAAGE